MADRPILFSAPMVRALLDGRKTQTRRALSRSWPVLGSSWQHKSAPWEGLDFDRAVARDKSTLAVALFGSDDAWPDPHIDVPFLHPDDAARGLTWDHDQCTYRVRPPFSVGDRLWVKETWSHTGTGVWQTSDVHHARDGQVIYRATDDRPGAGWFPSIFMFRKFSRLTLLVTDVRVERLQAITESDAIAEGVYYKGPVDCDASTLAVDLPGGGRATGSPASYLYQTLWNSINGAGAWEANPWVVAVSFDVEKHNIDST